MALADMLTPFQWGEGGQRLTPEQIAERRRLAETLSQGAIDTSPTSSWAEGLNRVAQGLMAGYDMRTADRAAEQNAETNSSLMAALLGGVGGSSASPATASPSVASALTAGPTETPAGQAINSRVASAHGGDMVTYQDAIASIESAGSGDYSAIGPTHPELGRALGRYQVMEANIGPWSEAALGYSVTPDEFMASPEIQDAIFNHQFGEYVNQYGPEGAAQAWFGGPGGVGQTSRSDSLGTTIGEYGQKFNAALGGGLPEGATQGQIARGPDGQTYQNVEQLDGSWDWSRRNLGGNQGVQVAQSGGINPAIIEAMTSPYVDDSTRQMASILLEQQLQQNDPAAQLEMEIQREKLNQLRNPQQELTAEQRNLSWRAQQAGLQPGTEEYAQFMLNGGGSPDQSATQQRIARLTENLMATGDFVDPQQAQNIAIGIVDGRLKADRHPVTGQVQVIDMATGQPAYQPSQPQEPATQLERIEVSDGADYGEQYPNAPESFGVGGAAMGLINRGADALGVGAPYPEVQQTQADFGVLRESLLNDMASAYNRQPPSWLLREIRELTPSAGSPFQGAEGAQSQLRSIGRQLESELRVAREALGRDLSPTNRQEVEAKIQGLESGLNRVDTALQAFRQEQTGSLPEGVTEEDIRFTMEKHGLSREQVLERIGNAP